MSGHLARRYHGHVSMSFIPLVVQFREDHPPTFPMDPYMLVQCTVEYRTDKSVMRGSM